MSSGTTVIHLGTRKVSLATEKPFWWECLGYGKLASDQVMSPLMETELPKHERSCAR